MSTTKTRKPWDLEKIGRNIYVARDRNASVVRDRDGWAVKVLAWGNFKLVGTFETLAMARGYLRSFFEGMP